MTAPAPLQVAPALDTLPVLSISQDERDYNKVIMDHEARVRALESGGTVAKGQYTSIINGGQKAYDILGRLKSYSGIMPDGTAGVAYAPGDPPPKPSQPIVYPRPMGVLVGHLGTFASSLIPGNLGRFDVHMSNAGAGFIPTAGTQIDSLPKEGGVTSVFASFETQWIKLVAVTNGNTPGTPTDAIEVHPLPVDQIAAGAIGADELAAILILASQIIVGTPGAGRIEINPTFGMKMYSPSNVLTGHWDNTTGDFTLKGSMRTNSVGNERWEIGPNVSGTFFRNEIRGYPNGGADGIYNYAKLVTDGFLAGADGFNFAAIAMLGPMNKAGANTTTRFLSDDAGSYFVAHKTNATVGWGPKLAGGISGIDDEHSNSLWWKPGIYHDASFHYFQSGDKIETPAAGSLFRYVGVNSTSLYLERYFGNPAEPAIHAFYQNIGMNFASGRLYITNGDGSSHGPVTCLSLVQSCDSAGKTEIDDITTEDFKPRDVIKTAKVKGWRRNKTGKEGMRPRMDPTTQELVPINDIPELPRRRHFSPMADDLPPELYEIDPHSGQRVVDHMDLIGVLWAGHGEQDTDIDKLQKENKKLKEQLDAILAIPVIANALQDPGGKTK